MSKFRYHFFVCTNERPSAGRPSCGAARGGELFEALSAAMLRRPELRATTTVTRCGCLGPCFDGPTVVVYPEAVWYAGVSPADADELIESHAVNGRPLDRLRYKWDEAEP